MVSWASVPTHTPPPLSAQYDWRDVPERLEVTSPVVPASVFALMLGPDEDPGEASGAEGGPSRGPSFRANGTAAHPPAASLPTSPQGSGSSSLSQPPPAATLPSRQASNPSMPSRVPPDIQPAPGAGPSGDQAPAEALPPQHAPAPIGAGPTGGPAAVPPAPAQAQARPAIVRRYTGWGDPNAPPPIAWPPASNRAPSRPPQTGKREEAPNGKIEARGTTEDEEFHEARSTSGNEETQEPPEESAEALKGPEKSQNTMWKVLERFAAWRSKYYDAQERWILVLLPLLLLLLPWIASHSLRVCSSALL